MKKTLLSITPWLSLAALSASALEISLDATGIRLKAREPVGSVLLSYPKIGAGDKFAGPGSVTVSNQTAYLVYPNGARSTLTLAPDGKLTLATASIPADPKVSNVFEVPVAGWKGAVSWVLGDGAATPFPDEKFPGAFMKRGDFKLLQVSASGSEGFKIELPFGYSHLVDMREWGNNQHFKWETFSHLPADSAYVYTITSADGSPVTLGASRIITTDDVYIPYPEAKEELWPGKGPIRTFGWQDGIRRNYFNNRDKDQNAIVFVGDSLTENWRTVKEDFPLYKVADRGVGGDTSRGILFRLGYDVLALNPQMVFMCAGANDLTAHGNPEHTLSNLEEIIRQLRAYNARMPIVISTIPPSSNPKAPLKPGSREAVNAGIAALDKKYDNVTIFDLSAACLDASGQQDLSLFAADRLHLGPKGYQVWKKGLTPILEKILTPKNNTKAEKMDLSSFKMVWNDEFDGTALDPQKWQAPVMNRQGASRWHPRNVSVANGELTIAIHKTQDPTYRYDTAGVRTSKGYTPDQYLYAFKYGYVETRMKLPKYIARADYWVGFWMLCGDIVAGNNDDSRIGTEIDIFETFDMWKLGAMKHTLHWGGYGAKHNAGGFPSGPNLALLNDDWHTYGLYWDEQKYVYTIDGVTVCEMNAIGLGNKTAGKTPSQGTCRNPGFIKISVEAAPWCGPTSQWEKTLPSDDRLIVDYVRVYQKK